ncbi:antibiotic biosynthesis monooxygenase [Arsenicitalea aurantiaca]|uniref:Antibiotic biosynthesis monooxygenase n=1 Tax=Arsenicitalea aurantiaca TaxID=1783274 RepID=A0A433XKJ9_9HYPH|nr:antibiotic biosynthesis monooxygenase [Arsenicitalea aurantiaca]RUT34601.1 antibiotic biosynthesis monooxygenase [Arsenicitalea aurantiaca]
MVQKALYVRLKPKPGKAEALEAFLAAAQPLVEAEPDTTVWFALREDDGSYSIFDGFPSEEGRAAHLAGMVAEALGAKSDELLSAPPEIHKIDVLAFKVPK